jgi:RimJ/RimL family protein N-acetyltransferase
MLREATDDDVTAMRRWRNHEKVRAVSLTTHEIDADEHLAWWGRVKQDPTRIVLIYEHDGVPSGVVTFSDLLPDPETDELTSDWSFYLDTDGVEASGTGLHAWMGIEREAVAYAFDVLGVRVLRGVTLASNGAVRQLHKRFGFTEIREFEHDIDGVATPIVETELRIENRRTR